MRLGRIWRLGTRGGKKERLGIRVVEDGGVGGGNKRARAALRGMRRAVSYRWFATSRRMAWMNTPDESLLPCQPSSRCSIPNSIWGDRPVPGTRKRDEVRRPGYSREHPGRRASSNHKVPFTFCSPISSPICRGFCTVKRRRFNDLGEMKVCLQNRCSWQRCQNVTRSDSCSRSSPSRHSMRAEPRGPVLPLCWPR